MTDASPFAHHIHAAKQVRLQANVIISTHIQRLIDTFQVDRAWRAKRLNAAFHNVGRIVHATILAEASYCSNMFFFSSRSCYFPSEVDEQKSQAGCTPPDWTMSKWVARWKISRAIIVTGSAGDFGALNGPC